MKRRDEATELHQQLIEAIPDERRCEMCGQALCAAKCEDMGGASLMLAVWEQIADENPVWAIIVPLRLRKRKSFEEIGRKVNMSDEGVRQHWHAFCRKYPGVAGRRKEP